MLFRSEGLDLKGTRQIQLLDPHFNEEKMRQIIGRGVRYKSHAHLPENERNVEVERYLTQNRPSFWQGLTGGKPDTTAEEYLHQLSQDKLRLNDQVLQLLKEQAASNKTAAVTANASFKIRMSTPMGDSGLRYLFAHNDRGDTVMHGFAMPEIGRAHV